MSNHIEKLKAAPLEHQGQRVITLGQMDEAHQRPSGTAGRAFRKHRERLVEGQDYFTAPPDVSRRVGLGRENGSGASPVLLTEAGYLLLVKTFRDDLAWQVQRELVTGYFRARAGALDPFQDLVIRRLDAIESNQWNFQHGFNAMVMREIEDLKAGQKRLRAGVRHGLFGRQGGRSRLPRSRGTQQLALATKVER